MGLSVCFLLHLLAARCAWEVTALSSSPVPTTGTRMCTAPRSIIGISSSSRRRTEMEMSAGMSDNKDETCTPTSIHRRELFSRAISASAALASLSISRPAAAAAAAAAEPMRLSASWSATSGLNSLDPQDPNFVSFDPSAYAAMRDDPSRTPLFRKALQERLNAADGGPETQVVLDLGTGPFALFAVMAAEMGAGKVYAIEANPAIAENARKTIQKLGFEDIITVLDGFSTDISLPNSIKADVIVAEIVGSIATEEGASATILDAHRRLAKDPTNPANWIPNRIQTWAAPASYTLHNLFTPPDFDWTKIAAEPVRFNCRDLGLSLLDEPQCVEDISFADIHKTKSSSSKSSSKYSFTASAERMEETEAVFFDEYRKGGLKKQEASELAVRAAHSCTGIAFWPRLYLPFGVTIDSRQHPNGLPQKSHWQTVLPIMGATPAVGLQGGDKIEVTCQFEIPENIAAPRYSVVADIVYGNR
jgi:predicted RNA methylase